jgi:hypothetical protein
MQMMDDEKSKFEEDIRTFAEQIKALNEYADVITNVTRK